MFKVVGNFQPTIKAAEIIKLGCGCQQFRLVITDNYPVANTVEVRWWHSIKEGCTSPTPHNFDGQPKAHRI
jgi:hypothetical protein